MNKESLEFFKMVDDHFLTQLTKEEKEILFSEKKLTVKRDGENATLLINELSKELQVKSQEAYTREDLQKSLFGNVLLKENEIEKLLKGEQLEPKMFGEKGKEFMANFQLTEDKKGFVYSNIEFLNNELKQDNQNQFFKTMSPIETKTYTGFIGQEPEIKELPEKGTKVANFSIAVQNKDNPNKPDWHQCSAWGEDADKIKALGKGAKITVSGVEKVNEAQNGKTYANLQVKSIEEHKFLKSQELIIGNIEFKTPKEKELCELVGYKNFVNAAGQQDKETFKMAAFGQVKEALKEADFKVGDKIYINAEGKMNTFQSKEGQKSEMNYVITKGSKEPIISQDKEQGEASEKKQSKTTSKASKNSQGIEM